MTVLEASAELFDWFDENDKFDLEEDISKLLKKPSKSDKAAIKCALEDFEEMDVVKSTMIGDEKYWVLKKSFGDFQQEVSLAPKTCQSIAQVINVFREILNVEEEECDPRKIKEADVNNIILICYHYMNNDLKKTDPKNN